VSDQGEQPEQPQQPQIPQEYLQAHEWRAQIEREAEAFGGLDMVPRALKWGRMLFGLEQAPEGVEPGAHFLNELYRADRQAYAQVMGAAANEHADRFLEYLEDHFFAKHGIPKYRLPEIQDFVKYGPVSANDVATRAFVQELRPEFQAIFPQLSEATRNWLVQQVDRGLMTVEFAEEQIREKGILLAIEERDAQAKQREAEAAKFEEGRRAFDRANQEIARFENAFVEAQSRKHAVDVEIARDWVTRVAAELGHAAQMDPRHPAKAAWDDLVAACASGNDMRIKPAMSRLQTLVERGLDDLLTRRGKAPANSHQPPGQPQFEPPAGEDWSKISLDGYLHGRAGG
jgi:hypothetical protein